MVLNQKNITKLTAKYQRIHIELNILYLFYRLQHFGKYYSNKKKKSSGKKEMGICGDCGNRVRKQKSTMWKRFEKFIKQQIQAAVYVCAGIK